MPSLKAHATLLAMSVLTWAFFVLLGLPHYYQHWPLAAQLAILPAVSTLYLWLAPWLLRRLPFPDRDHRRNALWLALYLTVPLFVCDVLYIRLLGGEDWGFLLRYWYLSFFYVSFWLQFPWSARRMIRAEAQAGSGRLSA